MTTAERGRITMELFELAEKMVRARFRRDNPGAEPDEEEEAVVAWLRRRPGAGPGDCEPSLLLVRPPTP